MTVPNPTFEGMDAGQAGQALAKWAENLQRRADTFQQLQQQMSQLGATVTSSDGTVRVSVDSQGVPTELTVTERGRGGDPAALSQQLMACLKAAQGQLTGQVQELMAATVPGDDGAERIIDSYRDRFPEEPVAEPPATASDLKLGQLEDEPAPPPSRPRRPDTDDDEDGWGNQSVFNR